MTAKQTPPDLGEFLDAEADRRRKRKRPCVVEPVIESLDEKDRATLQAALARPDLTNAAIREWLRRRGHEASIPGLTAHRHGQCTCQHD